MDEDTELDRAEMGEKKSKEREIFKQIQLDHEKSKEETWKEQNKTSNANNPLSIQQDLALTRP